jgi:hypothetical protein
VNSPGEIELFSEAEKAEGFARKIKYEPVSNGARIKFSVTGEIFYVDLPDYIASRKEAFEFLGSVLQRLNAAVHPARFVDTSDKKKQKEREKSQPKPEVKTPAAEKPITVKAKEE